MDIQIKNEIRDLIPRLSQEEFDQLENNCLEEGIRDSLVIAHYPDKETGEIYEILADGHNRLEIAQSHGLEYDAISKEFDTYEDVKVWIIRNQFGRRNINKYQRSVLALRLEEYYKKRGKENQGERTDISQISAKSSVDTRKELSEIARVSHDTIHKVKQIENEADIDVKDKLALGELTINQAYQDIQKKKKIEQVREKEKEAKEKLDLSYSNEVDIFNTDTKFSIIYADPAWSYWEGGQKNQSLHYSTMSVDQICSLPVKDIAEDNSILFLWVTYPILQEAFKVIESWGFEYSTCGFVWVKKNKKSDSWFFGNGSWTRANTELCLIAKRGSITRMDASISQVLDDPIMEHSQKPYRVRGLITDLVGELPRIELFSRCQKDDGWFNWGNKI